MPVFRILKNAQIKILLILTTFEHVILSKEHGKVVSGFGDSTIKYLETYVYKIWIVYREWDFRDFIISLNLFLP